MMCGGFTGYKAVDNEVKTLAVNHKTCVEGKLGTTFTVFEPVEYATQVVAGTNYMVKIHVGDSKHVMAKIHKPLPHTGNPTNLMEVNHA